MLPECMDDVVDEDYEDDHGLYDATEIGDVSSDLRLSHRADSGVEDLRLKPKALAKRKASADVLEETQSQKKVKQAEDASQDLTDTILTTVAATEKPQETLSPTQKNYLAKKLATLQGRKFVAELLSSETSLSDDSPTDPAPMDLNKMMAKLLEDKYTSATAFRDDMDLVVGIPNFDNRKKVLDHVDKFMEKLPKSLHHKSKADASAAPVPRKLLAGQSAVQERETAYALKQVEAYRRGTQSNQGKKVRNLIHEKLVYLEAEVRKENAKLAERKRRHEASTRSMSESLQSGENIGGKVEAGGVGDDNGNSEREATNEIAEDNNMEQSEDEVIDNDTVEKITDEHEDEEVKDDLTDKEVDETVETVADTENGKDQGAHMRLTNRRVIGNVKKTRPNNTSLRLTDIKSYEADLAKLSKDLPTQQQIAELDRSATRGPNFMGRTASTIRGAKFGHYHNKTNGYTSHDVLLPAADSRNKSYCSHQNVADLTHGELVYMVGNHLIWKDLKADEFLSYSQDPLFLVVHALRRHHEDQGNVTIQFLDRRKVKTPDGNPANFYNALDVYTTFEVPRWSGWTSTDNIKLHPRKFTHECLTHGPVLASDTVFKQARIKDLINDGLYEIFPDFEAPEDHKRSGLYTLQVVYRKIGYPPAPHVVVSDVENAQTGPATAGTADGALYSSSSPPPSSPPIAEASAASTPGALAIVPLRRIYTPESHKSNKKAKKAATPIYSYQNCLLQKAMTVELLTTVRKVTLNFRETPQNVDKSTIEPPLHAFICFLTFEKRRKADPTFVEWIKKRYNGMLLSPSEPSKT